MVGREAGKSFSIWMICPREAYRAAHASSSSSMRSVSAVTVLLAWYLGSVTCAKNNKSSTRRSKYSISRKDKLMSSSRILGASSSRRRLRVSKRLFMDATGVRKSCASSCSNFMRASSVDLMRSTSLSISSAILLNSSIRWPTSSMRLTGKRALRFPCFMSAITSPASFAFSRME